MTYIKDSSTTGNMWDSIPKHMVLSTKNPCIDYIHVFVSRINALIVSIKLLHAYSIYIAFCVCFSLIGFAQSSLNQFLTPSDTLHIPRRNAVVVSEIALSSSALIGLNELWYADFARSKFHTVDDNAQWLQMDKVGHVFTAYQMGKHGVNLLNWSGVSKKDQLLYGATLGFGFLTAVEIMDGFGEKNHWIVEQLYTFRLI